jgi:putative transcriptional regulator
MSEGYLAGQLLLAMPNIGDPRFEQTVIFICAHSSDGAMGLVINKPANEVSFDELLDQIDVKTGEHAGQIKVFSGGPVETSRGFVLHSKDYCQETTLQIGTEFGLTTTVDILQSLANGSGPDRSILALGYAGWGAGQLDHEIQSNGWLNVDPDVDLVFGSEPEQKWTLSMNKLGFDPAFLMADAGRA